jgi:hypothetical protein
MSLYPTPTIDRALGMRLETCDLARTLLHQTPNAYLSLLLRTVETAAALSDSELLDEAPDEAQLLAESLLAHSILELAHFLEWLGGGESEKCRVISEQCAPVEQPPGKRRSDTPPTI